MAHYAEIDQNNIVLRVIVVPNEVEPTEQAGIEYCQGLLGGNWIKTSYNHTIRKNFAGIGFQYDPRRDAFIPPKPYPSWKFIEETCRWEPPFSAPASDKPQTWDEISQSWVENPIL
jgi:hypothetical protein